MIRIRTLPWPWIAAGVASYVAFVVATAPAAVMGRLISRSSDGRVVLSECLGTFWNGTGTLTLVGTGGGGATLQARWTLRILPLAFGRLGADVTGSGSGGSIAGRIEAGPRSLVLRRFAAAVPAAWSALIDFPLLGGDPQGQLRLESPAVRVTPAGVTGGGALTWQNAATSVVGPLGSYRLTLNGTGASGDLTLESIADGALAATGRGTWEPRSGAATLTGTLAARGANPALTPLLDFVGPESGGFRPFSLAANIPFRF